jgi:UDP-3-O-[3-hydroxymyristoyl] glucosamine N-acyltransferase
MGFTIGQIAAALGAASLGDATVVVSGVAEPASAGPDDLAIALSAKFAAGLAQGHARAALVWDGADWQAMGLRAAIVVTRSRLALAHLTQLMDVPESGPVGVHPTALVDPGATLGADVSVGPFSVIGAGAQIGAGTRIGAHVTIAAGVMVGAGGLIHDGVRLRRRVQIGARVILQPNVVIGADGFSFTTRDTAPEETIRRTLGRVPLAPPADATRHRIHSLGGVTLGDDIEVGANSTIDAGTIRPTRVGNGTKIDNLVQVGHNVVIGIDCLLCGHVGIAGSVRIGDRVVLAGKAGVGDNLTVGSDVVVTAAAIVLSDVASGQVMIGTPAQPMQDWLAARRALRQIPRDRSLGQNKVPKPAQTD